MLLHCGLADSVPRATITIMCVYDINWDRLLSSILDVRALGVKLERPTKMPTPEPYIRTNLFRHRSRQSPVVTICTTTSERLSP